MHSTHLSVSEATAPLLEVRDLSVEFRSDDGTVRAVDQVSFSLAPGQTLGIVGESGSGKSAMSLSLLGLLPPSARIGGSVQFRGRELLGLPERQWSRVRGNRISMVFQDPMTSLNPFLPIGEQLVESLRIHEGLRRVPAEERGIALLDRVGIPAARRRLNDYPHQFSGGMRQRVMIAMALACRPDVVIADEPTTALDVTIQAQILELLREIQQEAGMALILITHDLGVVAEVCDWVRVMYAGRFVESAAVRDLFNQRGILIRWGCWNRFPSGKKHAPRGSPLFRDSLRTWPT